MGKKHKPGCWPPRRTAFESAPDPVAAATGSTHFAAPDFYGVGANPRAIVAVE
jgi:hypothetical protein